MLLSEIIEAIYAAGYNFNTAQAIRRRIIELLPSVGDQIMDQPMSTAQADPMIPEELGLEILEDLSIPVEILT
jgi:siroheme synthase (precorrin-2 oxidase/ferrochelatase)